MCTYGMSYNEVVEHIKLLYDERKDIQEKMDNLVFENGNKKTELLLEKYRARLVFIDKAIQYYKYVLTTDYVRRGDD